MPVIEPVAPFVPLPRQPAETPWPTNGWPSSPLADAAVPDRADLLDEIFADGANTDESGRLGQSLAFVAVHNGRLIEERYGPTAGPEETLISWSMAKSVTQALLGVLVRDGVIRLNDRAPIEAWSDPTDQRHAITIDHLLRMVPGLEFVEDYVDDQVSHCIDMLFGAGQHDMAAYTAALPAIAPANTVLNYSSGTTNLLSRIIADAVEANGDDFERWAQRNLFDRIGMQARLTFDSSGTWVGSSYLHATARDFAKFGLLYLRDGIWEDERLLPVGWVDHARTLQATTDDGAGYGAHWWIWPPDRSVFFASGFEGQRLLVDPVRDLVLVRLGKTDASKAAELDSWIEQVRLTFPTV